jgi:proline iminopeptidase
MAAHVAAIVFFEYIRSMMHEGSSRPQQAAHSRVYLRVISLAIIAVFVFSFGFLVLHNRFTPTRGVALAMRNPSGEASTVTLNGFSLWYRERGTETGKPPVIVLHGGPAWSSLIFRDAFAYLESDRRVIYYDQRGSGNSQVREDLSYYTMSNLVTELDALRRDVVKADSVVLLAHDFGGALAQWYALAHPGDVHRMILLSPLPADGYRMESIVQVFQDPIDAVLTAGFPPDDPQEANRWQSTYDTHRAVQLLHDHSLAPYLTHLGGIFTTARSLMTSLASGQRDYSRALEGLEIPTLIVYGSIESNATREEYQIELHRTLSHSTLIRLEECGHWAFLEQPDALREIIIQFLREEPPAASAGFTHRSDGTQRSIIAHNGK